MIDFSPWDQLLKTYVNDRGQVDYAHWQQQSASALAAWLEEYKGTQLATLDAETGLAFLINLYNALTIAQILKRYPIDTIRPQILGMPNWAAFLRFFTQSVYALDGSRVSLNGIEHDILRQRWQEPRIHFALVCASVGCPLLRPEAYWGDRVREQLEEDAQRFINNPEKVKFIPEQNRLQCSKIFRWYAADFLQVATSVPAYIGRYLRTTTALRDGVAIAYLPYDWSLNRQPGA